MRGRTRSMRLPATAVALAALAAAVLTPGARAGNAAAASAPEPASAPSAGSTAMRTAGTLELRAVLAVRGLSASRRFGEDCQPGTPALVECFDVTGSGTVRGLGRVSMTSIQFVHTAPEGCPPGGFGVLGGPMRLTVAGKGTIEASLGPDSGCRTLDTVLSHTRPFTIIDGTGAYAGATGAGSVRREANFSGGGTVGRDIWTGTLSVPGLDFDVVAPSISGATARTVRVPRRAASARVTYAVKALDARDGVVPVTCKPRSGARFRVGRTRVTCTATDTSGNSRVVRFWVTVRRAR